jgi:hypothetical protein
MSFYYSIQAGGDVEYNRVLEFATRAHEGQFRKGGQPYITHPIAVAEMIRDGCIGSDAVVYAALLHDVVEDTDVTVEQIRAEFGNEAAGYVQEVTDDTTLPQKERRLAQFRKMHTMSFGAAAIKLADMAHNLGDRLDHPELFDVKSNQLYFTWKTLCWTQIGHLKWDAPFAELYKKVRCILCRAAEMGVLRPEEEMRPHFSEYYYIHY